MTKRKTQSQQTESAAAETSKGLLHLVFGLCGLCLVLCAFLHRVAHHVAPFSPGTVVVADVGEAKEIFQHKPRVAAALADAAVSDDVIGILQAQIALVNLLELLGG